MKGAHIIMGMPDCVIYLTRDTWLPNTNVFVLDKADKMLKAVDSRIRPMTNSKSSIAIPK